MDHLPREEIMTVMLIISEKRELGEFGGERLVKMVYLTLNRYREIRKIELADENSTKTVGLIYLNRCFQILKYNEEKRIAKRKHK